MQVIWNKPSLTHKAIGNLSLIWWQLVCHYGAKKGSFNASVASGSMLLNQRRLSEFLILNLWWHFQTRFKLQGFDYIKEIINAETIKLVEELHNAHQCKQRSITYVYEHIHLFCYCINTPRKKKNISRPDVLTNKLPN